MATAVFGRKKHMTQAFQDDGTLVSVTIIEVEPNFVTAVRTAQDDGYDAVQVGFGVVPTRKVNKPHAGEFEKHEVPPRRHIKELRGVSGEVGSTIGVDVFGEGDKVHVTAVSKGKGFQGTVKRHGFGRGPVSHGSHNVRAPGSVGASADPSRIFPGKRMPGQMGNSGVTVKNLRVVAVDADKNELWVRGGVPGGKGSVVKIRKAGE
ncbi:MAG: 50S ribosomal protein L3 [Actinobacteria bacterium]|nr:50S ribosomal protein L3 [Actinomycetota bacterium]PLS86247.1 MAG: 50S ribosomal protein L3 [Actinomycetota bacterium]